MNTVKDVRIIDTVEGTNHIVVMVTNTSTVTCNTQISVWHVHFVLQGSYQTTICISFL